MPRIPRGLAGGGIAHILSRGNGRATVFHNDGDYEAFLRLLDEARSKSGVELMAFCIMPNHFHVVGRYREPDQLSGMMHQWLNTHVQRYMRRYETTGHIWQGRFKSFAIQEDEHFLRAARYVLLNPCRASLASDPWEWPWSSLQYESLVSPWPLQPPGGLESLLTENRDEDDERLRESIRRGAPYGDDPWREAVAKELGLEGTLRPIGRPKSREWLEGLGDTDATQ
jgi:putative transposase